MQLQALQPTNGLLVSLWKDADERATHSDRHTVSHTASRILAEILGSGCVLNIGNIDESVSACCLLPAVYSSPIGPGMGLSIASAVSAPNAKSLFYWQVRQKVGHCPISSASSSLLALFLLISSLTLFLVQLFVQLLLQLS